MTVNRFLSLTAMAFLWTGVFIRQLISDLQANDTTEQGRKFPSTSLAEFRLIFTVISEEQIAGFGLYVVL